MKKRVFIAINLPREIKEELTKLLSQLKKINSSQVIRYIKPQGIHLTLHFLGYLDDQQIKQVQEILKSLANQYSATELITQNIAAFPNLARPRVIFLASQEKDEEKLISLQKNLGQQLEKIGLEVDHRPWQLHLTLARIKGPCQFKTASLKVPPLKIPVESIELMESQLSPYGAEYKIISSYQLQASP